MPDLNYIAESLRQFAVPIDSLIPDARNARLHPDRNLHGIRQSLRQFGQVRPVVLQDDGRTIIAGNGTWQAAQLEGWTHIAAMTSSLAGRDATAFGLADNRTAETAEWDFERVGQLITELRDYDYNTSALGWSEAELTAVLSNDPIPQFETSTADDQSRLDQRQTDPEKSGAPKPELKYVPCTEEQWDVIGAAVQKLREIENDPQISEGRAVELIVADWLSGQ